MNAKERIKELDVKMHEIYNELENLRRERLELSAQYSGYYIGNVYDSYGDEWSERLYPLGFITEEEAEAWAAEHNPDYDIDDDWWPGKMPPYYEVTKEEYRLYHTWRKMAGARYLVGGCEDQEDVCNAIDAAIADLKKKLPRNISKYDFIYIQTGF